MIPTLSVLIPTRNRPDELTSLISIIKECRSDKIEFIVSDNSDKAFKVRGRTSIKFVRPKRILNMTDNWNFLLEHAKGKYITFVGDDDAFIPTELIKLVSFADLCKSDIIWTQHAGYGWPIGGKDGSFYQSIKNKHQVADLKKICKKILNLDHKVDLPTPYCRVLFHRNILDYFSVHYPKEKFCTSRIPDISAATKISFISRSQVSYNRTVFISGASSSSNGMLTRDGSIINKKFQFNNLKFNPLPRGKLSSLKQAPPFGYIIWYEAFMSSITQLNLQSNCPERKIAFRSVFYSSNPRLQKTISLEIWKELKLTISFAYILNRFYHVLFNSQVKKFQLYISIAAKVLTNKSSVIIIIGAGLSNTSLLIKYLEKSRVLSSGKRIVKISLNSEFIS